MSNDPTAPERVQTAFRKLSVSATSLNAASDDLAKTITELDATLKKLNLGVSAWVQISGNADEYGNVWSRNIGYARIGNQWGIALGTTSGNSNNDLEEHQEWLFNDAPRWMRVEGVGKIPDLLEKLAKQADDTAEKIKKKTIEANELAVAIKKAAADSEPANKLPPYPLPKPSAAAATLPMNLPPSPKPTTVASAMTLPPEPVPIAATLPPPPVPKSSVAAAMLPTTSPSKRK